MMAELVLPSVAAEEEVEFLIAGLEGTPIVRFSEKADLNGHRASAPRGHWLAFASC